VPDNEKFWQRMLKAAQVNAGISDGGVFSVKLDLPEGSHTIVINGSLFHVTVDEDGIALVTDDADIGRPYCPECGGSGFREGVIRDGNQD
jgi:hypothetical protein